MLCTGVGCTEFNLFIIAPVSRSLGHAPLVGCLSCSLEQVHPVSGWLVSNHVCFQKDVHHCVLGLCLLFYHLVDHLGQVPLNGVIIGCLGEVFQSCLLVIRIF